MEIESIGVIGFGRFGKFWAGVLQKYYRIYIFDSDLGLASTAQEMGVEFLPLEELCMTTRIIFLCVPINQLENVGQKLLPFLKAGMFIVDTCSVKVYPAQILEKYLGSVEQLSIILTHPMFGPDSGANGVEGMTIVFWPFQTTGEGAEFFRRMFSQLGLNIVEITPDEHDRMAANSQGVTHQIGRILEEMKVQPTPIDTCGYQDLLSVVKQTTNDTWELFCDLQNYNPYTREMRYRLEAAIERINSFLLPERISAEGYIIGIQGGLGSFNEEACRHYCSLHAAEIPEYQIQYLYTSDNVLTALHQGRIDRGVFAIQNAKGGAVMETIHALTRHPCEILEIFDIVISHCIMHHPEIQFSQVERLISHPQALAQCADNLAARYPNLPMMSGQGELIDQALCAEYIASGELPRTTAVLAPQLCAQIYGLVIHDTDLQDLGSMNLTTFAWARRRHFEPV